VADVLKLSVYSPERKLIERRDVDSITLPTSEGEIQVLPGHVQMAGQLETGPFSYSEKGAEVRGVITSGFFEVVGEEIIVLAETLELASEIDAQRARLAYKKAEDALKEAGVEEGHFRKYQLKMQRAMIRQQEASRKDSTTH
jgi:F-type H+-transporting ATPase subunit epsilon